jgi:hypothetical protein
MADEVPADVGCGGGDLGPGLLDAVFAEVAESGFMGDLDGREIEGLGYCDRGDAGGIAAGPGGGRGKAVLDRGVIGADGFLEGAGGDGGFPGLCAATR